MGCSDNEAVQHMLSLLEQEQGSGSVMAWYEQRVAGSGTRPAKKPRWSNTEG